LLAPQDDLPDVLRYKQLSGYYATVRQDTDEELGVVGERYRIVRNHEAFAFVDQLLGSEIYFETAGRLAPREARRELQGIIEDYRAAYPSAIAVIENKRPVRSDDPSAVSLPAL
jgi:hypothetical protein